MTKIDFYILPNDKKDHYDRIEFACRLTEKAFNNGHKVLIAVSNEQQAGEVDLALWEFKPESFMPHNIIQKNSAHKTAHIEISFDNECLEHHDVLINLADKLPPYFSRFKRLAEIVIQETAVLKNTRENYTFYQQRGYPTDHHKL